MIQAATVWDDGLETDLKLFDTLQKYNATSSFALAPHTYKSNRTLNDCRDTKYGKRIAISELKEFYPFEILNHTANHPDLTNLDEKTTFQEISDGKKFLEDFFSRPIKGFCYPYGCPNRHCSKILKESGHEFARTATGWPITAPVFSSSDTFRVSPTAKWNHPDLLKLIDRAKELKGYLILLGHTYEFCSQQDWDLIDEVYKTLTQHPDVELVKMEDIEFTKAPFPLLC